MNIAQPTRDARRARRSPQDAAGPGPGENDRKLRRPSLRLAPLLVACALVAGPRAALAECPPHALCEGGDGYQELYLDEGQVFPDPWFALEVEATAGWGMDGNVAYRATVQARLAMMLSFGIGVSDYDGDGPSVSFVFPFWLLEVDWFGLYVAMGVHDFDLFHVGGGLSFQLSEGHALRLEAVTQPEGQMLITAGFSTRFF